MLNRTLILLLCSLWAVSAPADGHGERPPAVVMDEGVWVTFYDLPSRRFRDIRAALLRGDPQAAANDLTVTANYLSVEQGRAVEVMREPLAEYAARLQSFAARVDQVTLRELDTAFGRGHWLLAQHYLALARDARENRRNRAAGLYLFATTHHLERALLWNNVAISRNTRKTLDELRELAAQLQSGSDVERVYRDERPIVRAGRLLRQIGEQIDRPVLLQTDPRGR